MSKKILIVEDENLIAKVLSIRFENLGHKVFVAADGEAGLALVKKEKPDLVMLDIGLPKIDGNTLCELIKTDADLKHIKVVMLTGKSLLGDMENAFHAGADLYVSKPYDWARLLAQLQKLLP
ncbi:MAG TPA: response regulator [Elusimicrobiales bacterium]|nr:response regulator [Elusimicrobiales bacterium]